MPGDKFLGLEAARGVAAILVALVHAAGITAEPRFYGAVPFGGLLRNFGAGVDFFFVLSGFIIAWTHWDDLGRPERFAGYAARRLLRIYPIYWTVLIPLVAVYHAVPSYGTAEKHGWGLAVTSFFLLPAPAQPVLGVAWSLRYELMFYALFGLAIWRRGAALLLGGVLVAAIVVFGAASPKMVFPWSFLFNPRILGFALGVAVAAGLRRWAVPLPGVVLAAGSAGFVAGLLLLRPDPDRSDLAFAACFGPASAAVIAGLVGLERTGRVPPLRLFAAMGACSYAIYLVHVVAESACERPVLLLRDLVPAGFATLLIGAAGVAAGVGLHYAAERRVGALAKNLLIRVQAATEARKRGKSFLLLFFKKEDCSFLKKRTKKLFIRLASRQTVSRGASGRGTAWPPASSR